VKIKTRNKECEKDIIAESKGNNSEHSPVTKMLSNQRM
jgi:hypothetical protein